MSRDLLKRRGSQGFRRRWRQDGKDKKPGGMAVVWLMGRGVQDRGVEIREGPREATGRVQGSPEMRVAGDSDHNARGEKNSKEKRFLFPHCFTELQSVMVRTNTR